MDESDTGNVVSAKIERMMQVIAYLEWRKHRANVRTALMALIDMGVTFNLVTVLYMAKAGVCSPIDTYVEREIARLAEQQVVKFEIAGLWWDHFKGVA